MTVELREVEPAGDGELAGVLLRVQHAAYAVEAALIGDDRIPALGEDVDGLRAAPVSWLAAFDGADLVGALAWTEDAEGTDIDRLVVAPGAHRRGIGSALVRAVLDRGGRITVSTGRDNAPARRLYERLGFTHAGDTEVLPRLWVAHYLHSGR